MPGVSIYGLSEEVLYEWVIVCLKMVMKVNEKRAASSVTVFI